MEGFCHHSSGIDLSVGAVVGLSGVSMALRAGLPIPLAIVIALVASVVVGLFNGLLVHNFKVPAFIATLASLTIVTILLITGARTISNLPDAFKVLATGTLFGIPNLFVVWFFVILVGLFIANKTVFGRNIYSYGSNKEAANLLMYEILFMGYILYVLSYVELLVSYSQLV